MMWLTEFRTGKLLSTSRFFIVRTLVCKRIRSASLIQYRHTTPTRVMHLHNRNINQSINQSVNQSIKLETHLDFRYEMAARAPAATAGGMEVVKMKPAALDRIASIIFAEPAR
jgi:hypothetical protein